MEKKYIVDRIEGDYLVLEDMSNKQVTNLNLNQVDFKVKEGDVLLYDGELYTKDEETREEREASIKEKFERLKKKD